MANILNSKQLQQEYIYPYHMIDIYVLAVIVCYAIYLPYFIQDKMKQK